MIKDGAVIHLGSYQLRAYDVIWFPLPQSPTTGIPSEGEQEKFECEFFSSVVNRSIFPHQIEWECEIKIMFSFRKSKIHT